MARTANVSEGLQQQQQNNLDHLGPQAPPPAPPPPPPPPPAPPPPMEEPAPVEDPVEEPEPPAPFSTAEQIIECLGKCGYPEEQVEQLKQVVKELHDNPAAGSQEEPAAPGEEPAAEVAQGELGEPPPEEEPAAPAEPAGGEGTLPPGNYHIRVVQQIPGGFKVGIGYQRTATGAVTKNLNWEPWSKALAGKIPAIQSVLNDPDLQPSDDPRFVIIKNSASLLGQAKRMLGVFPNGKEKLGIKVNLTPQEQKTLPTPNPAGPTTPSDKRLKKSIRKTKEDAELAGLLSKRGS